MIITELFNTIQSRQGASPETSYTARLYAKGEDEILKKIGEESVEVILAGKGQSDERLIEEVADLTYHVLVLLALRGLSPEDIEKELRKRAQK